MILGMEFFRTKMIRNQHIHKICVKIFRWLGRHQNRIQCNHIDITRWQALIRSYSVKGGYSGEYSEQLKATDFSIFTPIHDFGFFGWCPKGGYTSLSSIKSKREVLRFVDLQGQPERLIQIDHIVTPKCFLSPEDTAHAEKFPYSEWDIASVHVAVQRGLNLENIDFCFGGSALGLLANKNDKNGPYIASRIPGTETIMIVKKRWYRKNLADLGFQFERYVTGRDMMDTKDASSVVHIHTMKVGTKTVLFQAEVDAIDSGSLVEVKASKNHYRATKVMFQMISSGSSKLCHGKKSKGVLTCVAIKNLSDVAKRALASGDVSALQKNITQGMDAIQTQLQDDRKYKITFNSGVLRLVPTSDQLYITFPPDQVVASLLIKN